MKWEAGRQGTGYFKKLLAKGSFWDCYLLKYPIGAFVPGHFDMVPKKRHFRLNIVLRGNQDFKGEALFRLGPIVLFRPDLMFHGVDRVTQERLVFSLGWVI
jgi:hypothetical protein